MCKKRELKEIAQEPKRHTEILKFYTTIGVSGTSHGSSREKDLLFCEEWNVDWADQVAYITLQNMNFVWLMKVKVYIRVGDYGAYERGMGVTARMPAGIMTTPSSAPSSVPSSPGSQKGNKGTKVLYEVKISMREQESLSYEGLQNMYSEIVGKYRNFFLEWDTGKGNITNTNFTTKTA